MSEDVKAPPLELVRERPAAGTVDGLEIFLGARGSGKSVAACGRARELAAEFGGAYIIGHSIGQRMPATLPASLGGGTLPITYHRSVAELYRGLRSKPERWHIVAPPLEDEDKRPELARSSADDVFRFAVRFSQSIRDQAWIDAHPLRGAFGVPAKATYTGLRAPPIIVVIDEGVAVAGASGGARGKGESTDWFREVLISLRHLHVVVLYCAQGATMKSWHLLEQATAIHVYQTTHQYALTALQAAGATTEELAEIRRLPLYSSITITPIARADRATSTPG